MQAARRRLSHIPAIAAGCSRCCRSRPELIVFGAAFGAVAAQKGLTLFDATLMSAAVFAGASQLAGMEIWSPAMGWSVIVALALVTAIINMRMILMSASLYPWLRSAPAWQSYTILLLLTEVNWLPAMRYRNQGGSDAAFLFTSGFVVWLLWIAATGIGFVFGRLLGDPRVFAIDLVLPVYFVMMLVPMWRGARRAWPWAVAGAVALAAQQLVPGFWYIIAGALAGAVAGGFTDDAD